MEQKYKASLIQKQFWLINKLNPENNAYNISSAFKMTGKININALITAINRIIMSHEIFRAFFCEEKNDVYQIILNKNPVNIKIIELSGKEVIELIKNECIFPFDLENGPLFRITIFKEKEDITYLVITVHHIIFDLRTKELFAKELETYYKDYIEIVDTDIENAEYQYHHYSMWQDEYLKSEKYRKMLAYWKNNLDNQESLLKMPSDFTRKSPPTLQGNSILFNLPPKLTDLIRNFSMNNKTKSFLVLLSVYIVFLHKYTGNTEIIIGVPLTNRREETHNDIQGCFVNILPIKVQIEQDNNFKDIFKKTRFKMLEAHRNQEIPYSKLVENIKYKRDSFYNPIFQTGFTFENPMELKLDGLEVTQIPLARPGAQLDLFLTFWEREQVFSGFLEYSTDLFLPETAEGLKENYIFLIDYILKNSEIPVKDYLILSETERKKIFIEWNNTEKSFLENICIHKIFEKQVSVKPDADALIYHNEKLSYKELNERANIIAHELINSGCKPDIPVCICLERSFMMVAGLLGILKSGGAYLPIDPDYPEKRIKIILEDSESTILLADSNACEKNKVLERLNGVKVILIDRLVDEKYKNQSDELPGLKNPTNRVNLENLAYVIYTSGSTGKPKGVMIQHKGILNRLLWMQAQYNLSGTDRVVQKTPFNFDVSVWEFFWPLICGITLVIAEPGGHKDNRYLISEIIKRKITHIHFVPSMLSEFLNTYNAENCTCLKHVYCSGEVLPASVKEKFYQKFTKIILHNLYGPTEASVDVTYHECKREQKTTGIPIGKPVANTQILILDGNLNPVPVNVPGDIYIGGIQLAKGYLNNKELTNNCFIKNPFKEIKSDRLYRTGDIGIWRASGNIDFIGRQDQQIKLRGFRIELKEIETFIESLEYVRRAVVIFYENKMIVAYIILSDESKIKQTVTEEIKKDLYSFLPDYMIPSAFVYPDTFPLNPNGKLDKKKLPKPVYNKSFGNNEETENISPQNEIQKVLKNIWQDILSITETGITNNFFDLGGNSLLLGRVQAELKKELDLDLSMIKLLQYPTILSLSEYLSGIGKKSKKLDSEKINRFEKQKQFLKMQKEKKQEKNK